MSDIAGGAAPNSGAGFMIGDVLGRSFSILGRNFVPFSVLSAFASLPYLAIYLSAVPGQMIQPNPGAIFLPTAVGFVLRMFIQAIILHGAFQDMRGRSVSLGESLRVGISRFLPILGVIILEGLGIGLGMVLLLVPGIILMLMWYVALPACVVEQIGPVESLRRSAALTKGHRWKILGLVLLVAIVGGVVLGVIGAVAAMFGHIGLALVQYLVQVLVSVYSAILVIVLYRDLRAAKEGLGTEQIAAVFD